MNDYNYPRQHTMAGLTYFTIGSYGSGHYIDPNMCDPSTLTEIEHTQYNCSSISLESECAMVDMVVHNGTASILDAMNVTDLPTFTKGCFYHYENNQMVWNGHVSGVDQCNEENGIGFCVCQCQSITAAPTPYPSFQPTVAETPRPTSNVTFSPTQETTIDPATVNPYWVEEEDHTQSYIFIAVGIILFLAGLYFGCGKRENKYPKKVRRASVNNI